MCWCKTNTYIYQKSKVYLVLQSFLLNALFYLKCTKIVKMLTIQVQRNKILLILDNYLKNLSFLS